MELPMAIDKPSSELTPELRERIVQHLGIKAPDDYFEQLYLSGQKPSYGYPPNHLPKTNCQPMKIVTSFMAARAAGK
jgi:hypothetical protein